MPGCKSSADVFITVSVDVMGLDWIVASHDGCDCSFHCNVYDGGDDDPLLSSRNETDIDVFR